MNWETWDFQRLEPKAQTWLSTTLRTVGVFALLGGVVAGFLGDLPGSLVHVVAGGAAFLLTWSGALLLDLAVAAVRILVEQREREVRELDRQRREREEAARLEAA